MLRRIFNLRNIYGTAAFILLLTAPGAVEAERYLTGAAMTAGVYIFFRLSVKEEKGRKWH